MSSNNYVFKNDKFSLELDNICLQTIPCKHTGTLNGKFVTFDGEKICKILKENGFKIPEHFEKYNKTSTKSN